MGFMDKVKGLVDPEKYDGDDEFDNGYEYDDDQVQDAPVTQAPQTTPQTSFSGIGNSSLELKVVRPERFESVTQIADHLLNNRTVVLNLEATNKETARRMIDFLSGVAYSIDGNLKKVANNTYVITPGNVAVSNDQIQSQFQNAAPAASADNQYTNL